MSAYREESEKAKLKKIGVIEQKENQGKAAKKKPYRLSADLSFASRSLMDITLGRYAKLDDALKAVKTVKKFYTNIKVTGPCGETELLNP
jgi:hypothetical protein